MWYIGLDVGGTHIDLVALSTEGTQVEAHHTQSINQSAEDISPHLVEELMREANIKHSNLKSVAVGWKHGRNNERILAMMRSFAKHKLKAEVMWDAESAFIGALPDRVGMVVAVGTGAVVYGCSAHGVVMTSGGWSALLGDPGSAFSIGKKALVSALRAEDKSGPATSLLEGVQSTTKMKLNELVILADAHVERAIPLLASICPTVFELAEAGDIEAVRIRESGAKAIAERVASVIRLWPNSETVPFSYAGRLMRGRPIYRQMIQNYLRRMSINLEWREPQFRAPYGAVLEVYPKMYDTLNKVDQSMDWHH